MSWQLLTAFAVTAWGVVGLLQKLSADLLDSNALVFWVTAGLVAGSVPLVASLAPGSLSGLAIGTILLGVGCGATNVVGSWCVFRALSRGAPAAVVIPLTALYPLVTVPAAMIFLGESFSLRQGIGALLAVGGGALLSMESPVQTPVRVGS